MSALRIAFVHPDLGIGGAERLVVDAAKVLQSRGHSVTIFTSHHSLAHCFEETKSKSFFKDTWYNILEELRVEVHGDFLPRNIFGLFHLLCAAIRHLFLSIWLYIFCARHYDVIIVDQISFGIPILRRCADRVLYYCHFPDQLLAPQSINPLRVWLYRGLFDRLEENTILMVPLSLFPEEMNRLIWFS